MSTVVVAATRDVDLYLRLDTGTGTIIQAGPAAALHIPDTTLNIADTAGATNPHYGWHQPEVFVCRRWLLRGHLKDLADAAIRGDTRRRAAILRTGRSEAA